MKKLYANVFHLGSIYFLGNIAQKALYFILIPLYTKYLLPEEFGIIALLEISTVLISAVVSEPINRAFTRFYYHPDYREKNDVFLFNMFFLLVIKILALAVIYWLFSYKLCMLLFDSEKILLIVQLYGIVLIFNPISNFLMFLLRLREMAKYYIFSSFSKLLLNAVLTIYLLVSLKMGILAVIYGNILGLVFLTLIAFPVFIRNSRFSFSLSIIKEPLKYGYPQLLAGYSNYAIQSGDRYVLRIFDSLSNVGLYSFGYKIASLINILLVVPLNQAILPVVLKKESESDEQKQFIANSTTYYYLLGIFMALLLSLFAREVIMLLALRKEFWASWVIVPIIAFSYVQHGLGNFVGWGLVMKNKSYHISANLVISAVANIGLNIIFIPMWGLIGAAFATMLSYLLWNGLKIYFSAKFYQLYFELKRIAMISFYGIGLYLISLFAADTDSLGLNLAIKLLILSAYPLAFFISGFFTKTESEYIHKLYRSLRENGLRGTYAKIKAT